MARRCVVVLAADSSGKTVMGELPNGKLKFPAGHADDKELPLDAAKRELKEETNLDGEGFKCVGVKKTAAGDIVYFYTAKVKGVMGVYNDPDEEFVRLHLIDPSSVPEEKHQYPFKNTLVEKILK